MKKFFLFALCLLSILNPDAYAIEHGIVFEEQSSLTTHHPYLRGINLNILPLPDAEKLLEVTERELPSYHFIAENEYATTSSSQEKALAITGIYDCIGLVIPTVNMMIHIHRTTNLESVAEIIGKHSNEQVFLYTCSITQNIEKTLNVLDNSGFQRNLITLSVKPMVLEELGLNDSHYKYSYSYDDTTHLPKAYMPQKVSFYVNEDEKNVIRTYYSEYRQPTSFPSLGQATSFITAMRSPVNIRLQDRKINLFKINYDLMRREQEKNDRGAYGKKHVVQAEFE